jgi:hypothetical protein
MSENGQQNVFVDLHHNQRKAAEALLSGADKFQAAEAAGVTRRTIDRYLNDPVFQAALDQAAGDKLGDVARLMVGAMHTATGIMLAVATNEDNSAGVRLRACVAIIQHGPKIFETYDLAERVKALEARIQ